MRALGRKQRIEGNRLAILKGYARKIRPWAAFLFALTLLRIGEYAIAELVLAISAAAFLHQIYSSPEAKAHHKLLTPSVLAIWLFFAVVTYNMKGHRAWSNIIPTAATAQIEIRPSIIFFNSDGGPAKLWVSSANPLAIRPANLALYVSLTNQGPASTAISDIYAETKGPTLFWTEATRLKTAGQRLYYGDEPDSLRPITTVDVDLESKLPESLSPNQTVSGWLLFQYGSYRGKDPEVRLTVIDGSGNRKTQVMRVDPRTCVGCEHFTSGPPVNMSQYVSPSEYDNLVK